MDPIGSQYLVLPSHYINTLVLYVALHFQFDAVHYVELYLYGLFLSYH